MNGNEKTKLTFQNNGTLRDYWSTYDPLGEIFFFAASPFFKHPDFLAPAFAFGCVLLREPSSSLSLGLAHYRGPPGPGHPHGQGKTQ